MIPHLCATTLFLACFSPLTLAASPNTKILLVGQGPDGHPKTTHEYMPGLRVLAKCLETAPGLEIAAVKADARWKEGPDLLGRADAVVLFVSEGAKWIHANPHLQRAFARFAAGKGGLVALHWAIGAREAKPIDGFVKLLGGCHGGPDRRYQVVDVQAEPAGKHHPILRGIDKFQVKDEFYYQLKFTKRTNAFQPILQVPINKKMETVAWSWERPSGGRSFGFSGLHFHDNWKLKPYRRLVAQAVLWTVKLPIPKFGLAVKIKDEDLKLK